MFYHIFSNLAQDVTFLNLFRYITFRMGGAILTALAISFFVGPSLIRWLKSIQKEGQPIREDGPESHLLTKQGTPTMGGSLILFSLVISTLLWANLTNGFVWATLFITTGFGGIGWIDDYLKLTRRNTKGLSGKLKLLLQLIIAGIGAYWISYLMPETLESHLAVPFVKNLLINFGVLFIPFAILVLIGTSNAVNLTDGLDGLAIGPIIIATLCFALISYLVGNNIFAHYLQINFVPQSGELAVFCGALIGAGLGFLWFNAPPAMIFMGDTGSLSVGGSLGAISIITKHELVLAIIGGLFVVETVSVILQVAYFKMSGGKRIFLMAPLHHHFEKKGWAEPTIVIRFWIIAVVLALIGLATLKLR
ncbi:MAG: phospho-N-acetylmuramoyl-pentapeptide-transferase [Alphaproteobacteria bacterium]|jgi:phospho-N-acetylmuramoyl-pentapeptide-transferase|nr:phospho-N-acetylmuramoyl-pentapeptide-transferase [Alphaproteobacteria bacterium]MBT5390003.1 phospho-N-acetylmuramoyl-pentapeptide-transferase [Alphaproteobacteria bacterium]MBT5540895.1 phospho-N-acetylmuramoyl-pentapeptide-transferase [Alphaproteobacteria bacterium]